MQEGSAAGGFYFPVADVQTACLSLWVREEADWACKTSRSCKKLVCLVVLYIVGFVISMMFLFSQLFMHQAQGS